MHASAAEACWQVAAFDCTAETVTAGTPLLCMHATMYPYAHTANYHLDPTLPCLSVFIPAAILRQLGIINSSVRLAGASGGAAAAALTCADVPLQQQFSSLQGMAAACRPTKPACQGFLDRQVNGSLSSAMPANAAALCSGGEQHTDAHVHLAVVRSVPIESCAP